jgi:CheY-like chemotaxis protein
MPVCVVRLPRLLIWGIQKLTGDEATRQLRNKNIPTPVIALTGRVSCLLASNSWYILVSERIAQRDGEVHGSWVSCVVLSVACNARHFSCIG